VAKLAKAPALGSDVVYPSFSLQLVIGENVRALATLERVASVS